MIFRKINVSLLKMNRNYNFIWVVSFIIAVSSCSPKIVQQTSEENYSEDLSAVLPPIDSVEVKKVEQKKKDPYVKPSNDITAEMNMLTDSLARDALQRKVTTYTIQVYIGNNRDDANEARKKVYGLLDDEVPRLEYTQPNFRVKVGKYNSRLDAHKSLTILKKAFPGALLIPERHYLKM